MLNKLMWFPVGKRLVDFLNAYEYEDGSRLFRYLADRDDMKIRLGSGNFGEYPALWVIFGSETEVNKPDSRIGAITEFWLDVYVKAEASPDDEQDTTLYRQAYHLEQELTLVLREFNQQIQKYYKLGTNFRIKDILSDGDAGFTSSNTLQHRIILQIEWYR